MMWLRSFWVYVFVSITNFGPTFSVSGGLKDEGPRFTLDGKPFTILSGSIHYFRVFRQYWKDRLLALKASGLNTVETYIAWNVHEEYPGEWDYSGDRNVFEFLNSAHELGLYAIVRPGPYICAEWDFGGLPAWLLSDPKMAVRTLYPRFLEPARRYLNDVLSRLRPYQYSRGGPIIAFQVENEYLSYANDSEYLSSVKKIFEEQVDEETLLFASDGPEQMTKMGGVPFPRLLTAVNFQIDAEKALAQLKAFQPDKPLMVGEFWDGWFDRWGDQRKILNESAFTGILETIIVQNASVNLYMFHGGTNFGFKNGANADNTSDNGVYHLHRATLTSYDYNAPVLENGELHPKFFALQSLIQRHFPENDVLALPERSANRPLGGVQFSKFLTLSDLLDRILTPMGRISKPTYVEFLCNSLPSPCKAPFYGFVVYRHSLMEIGHDTSIILSGMVGDRIQVIIDGRLINTTYAQWIQTPIQITVPMQQNSRELIIVVENMGRVNFRRFDDQRKGFEGNVTIQSTGEELGPDWLVYDLSFKKATVENFTSVDNLNFYRPISLSSNINEPAIYYAKFLVDQPITDQFLNFQGWDKGVVFINSFNLGRYWNVGPQKALYLPAPLLHDGENEIIMFELHQAPTSVLVELQENAEWAEPVNITDFS